MAIAAGYRWVRYAAAMPSHTRETTATYDRVASEFLEINRDRGLDFEWLNVFAKTLPIGSRVLDAGAGPGRDASDFRRLGLRPTCLDLSLGMLRAGIRQYPSPRVQADFRLIPARTSVFSGVWANASLLHLSPDDLEISLAEFSRVLVPEGALFLSVKEGEGADFESVRYGHPRWIKYWNAGELDQTLRSAGFVIRAALRDASPRGTWLVRRCVAAA